MTTIAEKHLRSVIPKPRDSDEEDPKVELNEEGEVLNIEAVTERLATDLKLTEFALKDIGEGEGEGEGGEGGDRTDYDGGRDGEKIRGSEDARVAFSSRVVHVHESRERWERWIADWREYDCRFGVRRRALHEVVEEGVS